MLYFHEIKKCLTEKNETLFYSISTFYFDLK